MGPMIATSGSRFILMALLLAGCGSGSDRAVPPPPPPPAAEVVAEDSIPAIVFLGTSLTAGYGLSDPKLAYPALIQRKLDSAGLRYRAVNRGVSGETSAGALRRIDWILREGNVAVLMVETGANDGLRGQNPDSTKANIQAIFDRARRLEPVPRLMLTGMEALPNLGADYTGRFRAIYPDLARSNGAALVPFLLEGVAGVDSLNQPDGIHPTARGQEVVAENIWRVLREVLTSVSAATP